MTIEDGSDVRRFPVRVVEAVAAELGQDTTDLPPMYDAVDLEAVDDLVNKGPNAGTTDVEVRFEYEGIDVRVTGDGVEVDPFEAE